MQIKALGLFSSVVEMLVAAGLLPIAAASVSSPSSSTSVSEGFKVWNSFGRRQQHVLRLQLMEQSMRFSRNWTTNIRCNATNMALDVTSTPGIQWVQRTIDLPAYKRGCHIITQQIYKAVPEMKQFRVGIAHIFVMHTSASLTINENASPDVPLDMEDALNKIAPEGHHYRHLDEGLDDMPAHVKSSLMGCSLSLPITAGRFNLGVWQGIWLNEHRDYGGSRRLCITLYGQC